MSRSMQLAHQAKTRKKITKESLLARFNFITPESEVSQPAETGHISTTTSSAPVSDGEGAKEQSTPPTSPMSLAKDEQPAFNLQPPAEIVAGLVPMEDEEFPATEDLLTPQPTSRDKGKTKATTVDEIMEIPRESTKTTTKREARPIRVRWSKQDAVIARGADSDSDLEIVTSKSKSKKSAAFESLPQRRSCETNSHLILRSLAYMQPGKAEEKHAHVNAAQIEVRLRRAARLQAQKEREEKLEELKFKGIFIQTAEERQREQQEVEDLVEQARVEGAQIQRREKEKAKRDGTFVKDQLDDDESADEEDADFQDENEELEDHESGSEEEIEEGSDQEGDLEREDETVRDHEAALQGTDMINQEADEAQSEDGSEDDSEVEEGDMTEKENRPPRFPARGRRTLVVSDDEDDEVEHVVRRSSPQIVKTPQSILRSARKIIPGLQMSDDLPIGLTQAFAATMADSLSQDEGTAIQEQDSLALALDLLSPQFYAVPSLNRLDSVDIITDSQPATQTQPLDVDLSITQTQVVPQLPAEISSTQLSFMPTQDVGYMMSPFKENRFDTPLAAPHSTIDTVILPSEEQSPILQRKGRLRRGRATMNSDDEALGSERRLEGLGLDTSAFAAMQRAAKRVDQQSAFDKTKSHAKEVVDEAAEESEDEYAGLGGASDDEEGEEDEADKRIIDHDESLGQGDEGKLAGFYA
jgi:mediator of replication checkpoint protein 1